MPVNQLEKKESKYVSQSGNLLRGEERSGEMRKINTRGGVYRCSNLTCSRGRREGGGEEGTMPRNDKGWKPGPCKLARYLLSARYKSVGKPSLTKSTLRNQNWGDGEAEGGGGGFAVVTGVKCSHGGVSPGERRTHPYIDVPERSPNRTIC